ncbi:MAG TPA: hypothetical protein VFY25_08205 [Anaerolineales bacterium]|nr:hypothetical protein [Anaerolineales bacterium]
MDATLTGLVLLAIGILIMVGSVLNWAIVTRPGKLFNRIFGDTVARIIYFVAGIFLFVVGIGRLIGANWF